MLAYLEGYAPVDLAVVIFPTDHNDLVKEGVWMPRHRRLLRIGIPKTGLLKGKFWDEAVAIILAHLSNREMLAS